MTLYRFKCKFLGISIMQKSTDVFKGQIFLIWLLKSPRGNHGKERMKCKRSTNRQSRVGSPSTESVSTDDDDVTMNERILGDALFCVDFTNLFREGFSYENVFQSFSLLTCTVRL